MTMFARSVALAVATLSGLARKCGRWDYRGLPARPRPLCSASAKKVGSATIESWLVMRRCRRTSTLLFAVDTNDLMMFSDLGERVVLIPAFQAIQTRT